MRNVFGMSTTGGRGYRSPTHQQIARRHAPTQGALLLAIVLTAALLAASTGQAPAATPGIYSAPSWFPLRGDHLIGCAYKSPDAIRTNPICRGTYHPYWAIDIKGANGEAVYAAGAGQVKEVVKDQSGNCNADIISDYKKCPNGSLGNHVLIDHGGGVFSYYQHLSSVSVNAGDWVDENTPIGAVGNSGWSSRSFYHLHFERRPSPKGLSVDPGPLKACIGSDLKTYPQAFGSNTWQD